MTRPTDAELADLLTRAASLVKDAFIAAAPVGAAVTVPHVQSNTLVVTSEDKKV